MPLLFCRLFFFPSATKWKNYPEVIGPSKPWQLTVIQWGVHMLITRVILMMIDVDIHGQGRVTWRITWYLLIKSLSSILLYFNVFGLRSPGALWRERGKYLQRHIQVVLIAANTHWKMLLSGNFGRDWVANAWKPWMPCMLSMPIS